MFAAPSLHVLQTLRVLNLVILNKSSFACTKFSVLNRKVINIPSVVNSIIPYRPW